MASRRRTKDKIKIVRGKLVETFGRDFGDNLKDSNSRPVIFIVYKDGNRRRIVTGFPYGVSNDCLDVGLDIENMGYERRGIPLKHVHYFGRIDPQNNTEFFYF